MHIRSLVAYAAVFARLVGAQSFGQHLAQTSPPYNYFYQFPLPIPPVKTPLTTYTKSNGVQVDYYEIKILNFTQQVYPNLGATKLVGYDGISPGPTFYIQKGRETVVRFVNVGNDKATVTHLHGSITHPPWDGWAEDIIPVGSYKDYYYPNAQRARTLWYHDHAMDHTAENAYFGQAGFYILTDDVEAASGLPTGNYDVPLALSSKFYQSNGLLVSPAGNTNSLFGDIIHVNGQPWPFLNVEPRKYRFRILNVAVSRTFRLYLTQSLATTETDTANHIPFYVVGSDAGRTDHPVQTSDLWTSMSERWEIVVDFAPYAGGALHLKNYFTTQADDSYTNTNQVMKFVVGTVVTDNTNNGALPASYAALPTLPAKNLNSPDHIFNFERRQEWMINGVTFNDVNNRILAKPARGTVQLWRLVNFSPSWAHPIHVHLVEFKVVARQNGQRGILPYEAASYKDSVLLGQQETVYVEARYEPWDGVYMFHCHNLIHEDHAMMAAFNVTNLATFNYPPQNTQFVDPMDARFRAKPYDASVQTLGYVQANVLPAFAALGAYDDIPGVEAALQAFLATATGVKDPAPVGGGRFRGRSPATAAPVPVR